MASPRSLIAAALLSILALVAVPECGFAQDNPDLEEVITDAPQNDIRAYVGVAIEGIELSAFDAGGFDLFPEATTTAVLRGGVILHRYFAVEGEAAIGIDNADGDGIANYDSRFAGYGRARFPFGDTGMEAFVRLGYASTSIDSSNAIGDGTMGGVSYGGGLAFNFGPEDQYQIRGDFTQFEFGNNQNSSAFALGVGYNF